MVESGRSRYGPSRAGRVAGELEQVLHIMIVVLMDHVSDPIHWEEDRKAHSQS